MNFELTPMEQSILKRIGVIAAIIAGLWLLVIVVSHVSKTNAAKIVNAIPGSTTNMYLFLFTSQGTNGTFTGNYRAKLTRVTANDFDQVQNLLSAQDTNRIWRVFNVIRFDE